MKLELELHTSSDVPEVGKWYLAFVGDQPAVMARYDGEKYGIQDYWFCLGFGWITSLTKPGTEIVGNIYKSVNAVEWWAELPSIKGE
jgi:hypothetical protein